jgi:cbb3-type cytochrome oxidase maturation protein
MISGMTPNSALLLTWIVFAAVALGGICAVIVWAVRSRQFANQDRARHLALWSSIPAPETPPENSGKGGADVSH